MNTWMSFKMNIGRITRLISMVILVSFIPLADSAGEPIKIIFDSDMGPDYDDVGALTMLHAFADSGKAEILATMASNRYTLVAPVLDLINTYYNRPFISVGSPKTHGGNIGCWQHWSYSLAAHYPHRILSTSETMDAVLLYRKILAAQP